MPYPIKNEFDTRQILLQLLNYGVDFLCIAWQTISALLVSSCICTFTEDEQSHWTCLLYPSVLNHTRILYKQTCISHLNLTTKQLCCSNSKIIFVFIFFLWFIDFKPQPIWYLTYKYITTEKYLNHRKYYIRKCLFL